jgi:hypothetical protein
MTRRRLVVVVPAWMGSLDHWNPFLARLKSESEFAGMTEDDWLLWDYRRWLLSRRSGATLARSLAATINQRWLRLGPYEDVTLVGHSLGGVLARAAYLIAMGAGPDRHESYAWGNAVSRIVLLAAPNRGVVLNRHPWYRPAGWLLRRPWFRHLLAADLIAGSTFITNLRIQWIRHFDTPGVPYPSVTQLLGDHDGLVTRDDSLDIEQFGTGYYKTVPDAGHQDLHRLDCAPDPDGRYAILADAVRRRVPSDAENQPRNEAADAVIFVMHGIRASNAGWPTQFTEMLREQLSSELGPARASRWAIWAPTYGYFSALRFALPALRRGPLLEFQDAYSQALARSPKADFHFVGHSNGTYLLGQSLQTLPSMQFKRVVLAGTVLPADYAWGERLRAGQVTAIRNDRAADDVPVGILCACLRGLLMRDVGTGGFDGFRNAPPEVEEVFWYRGGHSAAVTSENLPNLVKYVVSTAPALPRPGGTPLSAVAPRAFASMSRWAPLFALLLLIALTALSVVWLRAPWWSFEARAGTLIAAYIVGLLILDRV